MMAIGDHWWPLVPIGIIYFYDSVVIGHHWYRLLWCGSLLFIEDSTSLGPTVHMENTVSLLSHLNGEPFGWDFTVSNQQERWILFILPCPKIACLIFSSASISEFLYAGVSAPIAIFLITDTDSLQTTWSDAWRVVRDIMLHEKY